MKVGIDDLLSRFDGVRRLRAGSWAAKCSVHDDRHGSLVISEGDLRLVCFCHAGCDELSVLAMAGVDKRDLYYDGNSVEREDGTVNIGHVEPTPPAIPVTGRRRDTAPVNDDTPTPTAEVMVALAERLKPLYRRLNDLKGWGATAIEQCRLGWESADPHSKGARIIIPNYRADGRMIGYVRYLPGGDPKMLAVGPRELYPGPETLPASDYVWLVEGEPDRVSAVEIGLNAVAVPGVASWKPGWAERFRGRRVVVCFDCDKPGREHAPERAAALHNAGVEAVTVDLFPGKTNGYDLGDALTAASHEGRVDALRRYLIELEDRAWQRSAAA